MSVFLGERSRRVEEIQRGLFRAGFEISIDGYFGEFTAYTVSVFQFNQGMFAHGAVDDATADALGIAHVLESPPGNLTPNDIPQIFAAELALKFDGPNDPLLQGRRYRLKELAAATPAQEARALADRLGSQRTGDPLSAQFHQRLATPTRDEIISILNGDAGDAGDGTPDRPDCSQPTILPLVTPNAPLPPGSEQKMVAALETVDRLLDTDPQDPTVQSRLKCWVRMLKTPGVDDRIVTWARIYPAISGPLGAALVVGARDVGWSIPVDQRELERAIDNFGVDRASNEVPFMTRARWWILSSTEYGSESVLITTVRRLHDQMVMGEDKLQKWSKVGIGGNSAMPSAYQSIMDWQIAKRSDTNSVYSCH